MLEWRAILARNSSETKSFCGDYNRESLSTKKATAEFRGGFLKTKLS
jgi:hypothetical protein